MKTEQEIVEDLFDKWSDHPTIFYARDLIAAMNELREDILESAALYLAGRNHIKSPEEAANAVRALKRGIIRIPKEKGALHE